MSAPLFGVDAVDAASYASHPLHSADRIWAETNCYVDVWIEVLHSLGLEPRAVGAFTLSAGFEGDQWRLFKPPAEDLRLLYGIEVDELNVWRPVVDHVVEQLGLGRLLTVEVDAFYLPDTREVSYRLDHVKTTIVPTSLDREARRMGYFHNSGHHELAGEDFAAILPADEGHRLPPYVELVKIDDLRRDDDALVGAAADLARAHLDRRSPGNPVHAMARRVAADLDWLAGCEVELFHRYAFGICRQSGATAEIAADFVDWLGEHDPQVDPAAATEAAGHFRSMASAARVLQFNLARAAHGRRYDVDAPLAAMADAWAAAMAGAEAALRVPRGR